MKHFLVAVFLLLGASLTASRAEAQVDSCLALADEFLNRVCPVPGSWHNADSTMIDTCAIATNDSCEGRPDLFYAKKGFRIDFDSDVFRLPLYPADTQIIVKWADLDTSFHSLRSVFDSIQQRVGNFILVKHDPDRTNPDPLAGEYALVFDKYVNVSFVDTTLKNDSVFISFEGGPIAFSSVEQPNSPVVSFLPNPVHSTVIIDLKNEMVPSVDVFNDAGQLARHYDLPYTSSSFMIDLRGLAAGVYTIRCRNQIFRIVYEP